MSKWQATSIGINTIGIFLSALLLWGCAGSVKTEGIEDEQIFLREALQERAAAYARLAKAISVYCSVRYASPEAKQSCVLDKSVEATRLSNQDRRELNSGQIETDLTQDHDSKAGHTLKCEGTGLQTICQRIQPAFSEFWMGRH